MDPKSNSNLSLVGWLLLILGIILLINSLTNAILYIPVFLACFIIAIILISQKSIASGVGLLLITLILPPILWLVLLASTVAESIEEQKQTELVEARTMKSDIKFEDVKIRTTDYHMYCEGKIRNTGTKAYDYIKVKVDWLDKNDVIIDTDFTYAVSSQKLYPNEAKSFKIISDWDAKMKFGRYYVIE